jgi:hypothetical protein
VAEARLKHPSLDQETRERWIGLRAASSLLEFVSRRLDELVAYPAATFDRLAAEYVRADDGDWRIDAYYRALLLEGRLGTVWHDDIAGLPKGLLDGLEFHYFDALAELVLHCLIKPESDISPGEVDENG